MEEKKILHITNGDDLSEQILNLKLPGDVITWREMLCEGPASMDVGDEEFVTLRKTFLYEKYKITEDRYQKEFLAELVKLAAINNYDEVVLWFEFDLFSHMNMLALISFLLQNKKTGPFSLVCSRKLKGEEEMAPLSQLSPKHLKEHYKQRISLTDEDIQTAQLIWELYCSKNPKRLASEIKKTTNFEYLSSSIRAHIERFPSVKTGLNTLEVNVLKLIREHKITSVNHLLGYALQYQGYYGYVDVQMQRVLDKLRPFYESTENGLSLNDDGLKALNGTKNYYQNLKDDEYYGGVRKYDFLYDPDNHDILKL
ncbi:DUF1835 domain-containing protein [Salinimicrobium sp. TH3]|uniref:DUF1835 domain-containing protein n=1 Tax=Salinimicrobium sp. TH3 TaxID=2997342 RepID=UPI0022741FC1|nr:DUF1835 domain-containing protein [Salinimicrobium sp. TH3]MCY2687030.1 DUF1835 domain-containing protein [Salinimicrobium sp. TH3]